MSRTDKLSMHRTQVCCTNGRGMVVYIKTLIVEWDDTNITLRNDGWHTVTTKRKMNQTAQQFGLKFGVHQKKGDWFVSRWNNGEWLNEIPFEDGMTIPRI